MLELETLFNGGFRYVFFDSLLDSKNGPYKKLGKWAQKNISTLAKDLQISSDTDRNSQTKMDQALNFLKNAAEFERQQEIKFFENFKNQFPEVMETFKFDFSNEENIDIAFVKQINVLMKGTQALKKEINAETDRINRRRAADNYIRRGGTKDSDEYKKILSDQYQKAFADSRQDYALTTNGKITFSSIFSNNETNLGELAYSILEKFAQKLFTFKNGKIELNSTQTTVLIKIIIDKAYQLLMRDYGGWGSRKRGISSERIKQIAQSDEMEQFINKLLAAPNLTDSLQSIADQHGIKNETLQKINNTTQQIKNITNTLKSNYYQEHKNGTDKDFEKWRQENNMSDSKLEEMARSANMVSAQMYYTGEDLALVELLINGIGGALGGGANPTDDIQAGKLIVSFNIANDNKLQEKLQEAEQKLLQKQQEYFNNNITKTTTFKSFKNNTEALKELREEQNKLLLQLKNEIDKTQDGLEYLLEHINIHSTVKGYISAGRDNFAYYGGFEGAALGMNLLEQLNIIEFMLNSGGISMADSKVLYQAMINAGQNMIGKNNKRLIENYFSTFIGFLMFNDAALFAGDVKDYINNTFDTSSQDIHLYQLNGIFVPNSFILQNTYNSLAAIPTSSKDYSIRAKLNTYDKGPIKGDWKLTSETAADNTKLEIKFLAGFLDLLDNISKSLQG